MKEEIIKECEFYLPLSENCNEILDSNGNEIYKCPSRQDCYYKKLIRLEQDRKQLIQWLDEARRNADFWCDKCTSFEQENKELKEWKTKVVMLFESACRCKYLNEESDICSYTNEKCININKCVYKYQELSDTYRSALEEINILAKNYCNACDEFKAKTYKNKNDCLYCNYGFIKNKINKVLNS